MATRRILVTGATGKQGGAAFKAILANPPPFSYKILALTRNTSSPTAKALVEQDPEHVELVSGSMSNPDTIFESAGGVGSIWGVFAVTLPSGGKKDPVSQVDTEEKQGIDLVDSAIKYQVKHFVFTSVDRGGSASDDNPTPVPHFISKHNIEKHLKEKAGPADMTYTILRPVAFMENLQPNFIGKAFAAMWNNMGTTKLQVVATKDIGIFAALSFAKYDSDDYKNKAIGLAGDELTQPEAEEAFWNAMGRPMPRTYGFIASAIQRMVNELGVMFKWFIDTGYGVDIQECKRLNPGMLNFENWLKQESAFKR